ncbi:GntR family transcriptional regulator [Sinorhizobium medicae]|uniref:GntR family transcriptional regulator n=1 Tax=Sinorhizobium medicae TaxID=110321 RepID=UPI000C7B1C3F|nr:GntR family transcriptional regulator [Sinorhizobium medicae]MDX0766648.1 GntR family transcriptional regulator [Sinorhizobium medicae]MDX0828111.1 GntR family transcriptional regulator [Sinorhizobium medicae]MDX1153252.1 GntR family transcriptional regulator [Sinorhizobium medicae]PLT94953.1 GntR family transcriptional regulator [Sinorhizobium medicae]PLU56051.1 GntR family transcriptional regulator [Sinorhizobium medicae]
MFRHQEDKLGWDQSKVGQAYKALKNLVVNCQVPPCTRLDHTTISKVLNTSVTPVREALIQLETEGYIASFLGTGYYTKKLDTKTLSDHLDSTNMVLKHVFRANLYEHSKFAMLPSWTDYYGIRHFLQSFCESVAETTNNRRMEDLVHDCNIRTSYIRWLDLHQPERLSCIRDDMSELLELLDNRDTDAAIANVDRQFSAMISTVPELVLEGNRRAENTKESWLETLSKLSVES